MPASLQITAAKVDPALLDLPWEVPLEEWPGEVLAALPRGISRHIVRFVKLSGRVIAVKEIGESVAYREYELLRSLRRLEAPSVTPLAVITGRRSPDGEELNSVLVTEHLQYSLPYRALFSQYMRPETASRLIDALSVLLVRLHLLGFYWGDVSLSNTLFRRDAGAFAAYLVDAETGELHPTLTPGQRNYDVDLARTNIIGELMDLQAGEVLDEDVDVVEVGNTIVERYESLWRELTDVELFKTSERWRVTERINRLNALGFDVGELTMTTDIGGTTVSLQPKVVDAGHYHRQIMRWTGLDVQENQARRMLNDLEAYRAETDRQEDDPVLVAHDWMDEVFNPTVKGVPRELRRKLEPAEIFHEVLEHRWFLAEQEERNVPMMEAVEHYVETVLKHRPDERAFLDRETLSMPAIED
ncbi:DUF4032 domain-containing protein [Bogoriella caseilytica]|uniref:Lipopolysaccharide kinase (Kdo/WaaP) family protein n=1 Tax=Bogoriella caseilytica TaxID=56055 RepID=A0A3N2BDC3_9MICO|nr:DUF4032 domain-containing protein [Bogoriella caseilytica]ROR73251.1 lipopolysaccharide kinase (Kdo/WaaP) family protein [Bogoriella caseilytica]